MSRHPVLRRVLVLAALWLALAPVLAGAAARDPVWGARAMVVTSEPGAAQAGHAMLERGGNAVDAAVATAFALAVTTPFSAGVGGGAFLMIRDADGRVFALDARETAPAAASRDMYVAPGVPEGASRSGPLAVGTPGFVAGCALALERFGTLPLATVLEPAIALAGDGFAIGPYHARMIETMRRYGLAKRFPGTARIQFPPEGETARPGWRLVQPELAATLQRIAADGPSVAYTGEIGDAIVRAVRERGGILAREDLAAYRPVLREPVSGTYRGYAVHSFPPPSSGGVALVETLNLLEAAELEPLGAGSSSAVHRITEAMKLAFADRAAYLGDPDFVDVPTQRLASKAYADEQRARLLPAWWRTAPWHWGEERAVRIEGPGLPQNDAGTVHLSTADASGTAVALTMTINTPYGSGITAEGTGIVLNNEMDDFAIAIGVPNAYRLIDTRGANAVAAGKRPLSSMTPTIVEKDGALFMVTGSPGGPRIISTTLLSVLNVIDWDLDVSEAVSAPRFHHQWEPDILYVEPPTPQDVVEGLRARGHVVEVSEREWSAAEAIVVAPDGSLLGAADPRRDGVALGY